MKALRSFFLLTGLAVIMITSCKKSEITEPAPVPVKPTTLSDMKAPDSFNWSTGQVVTVKITGLPTVIPVKNTLSVSLTNGTKLFSRMHQMDQDLAIKVRIPAVEKQLLLNYGSTTKTIDIEDGIAQYSFIPVITE